MVKTQLMIGSIFQAMFSQILGSVLYTYRPYGTKEGIYDVFYKHIVPTGLKSISVMRKTH